MPDITPPYLCRVAQDKDNAARPYLAQVLKHRGIGYDPAPIASGVGSTPVEALGALQGTLQRNGWLKQYFPWPALTGVVEAEIMAQKEAA